MNDTLQNLYQVVLDRKTNPQEGSYTCYLFDQGLDKICKKVGEESAETIIAAKNGEQTDTVGEICDLIYHVMVLMAQQEIPLEKVLEELDRRSEKIGNLKKMKFFVCPHCGNVLTATGNAAIFCCGRKLEAEVEQKDGMPDILVEDSDGDFFVTIDHPMEKEHFISFVACITGDRCYLQKLYPEQNAQLRMPRMAYGMLYVYCNNHGLFRTLMKRKK